MAKFAKILVILIVKSQKLANILCDFFQVSQTLYWKFFGSCWKYFVRNISGYVPGLPDQHKTFTEKSNKNVGSVIRTITGHKQRLRSNYQRCYSILRKLGNISSQGVNCKLHTKIRNWSQELRVPFFQSYWTWNHLPKQSGHQAFSCFSKGSCP